METPFEYQYRIVPVTRLPQLQEEIDRLKHSGQLSDHPIFQGYLNEMKFALPEDFLQARSLIVLAQFTPAALVSFHLDGASREIIIPPQYYSTGLQFEDLRQEVLNNIIGNPSARLERVGRIHLKLLAVRTGLGRYGRNNICYVGDMGSFITLYAFFTDHAFDRDDWEEVRFLDQCENCQVCLKGCPTGAIRAGSPVIDAGRCITLYNEVDGPFPDWIPAGAHNALFGCLKCQAACPANRAAVRRSVRLEDIDEDATRLLLAGPLPDEEATAIGGKLHLPHLAGSPEFQSILRRNLRVLIEQPVH